MSQLDEADPRAVEALDRLARSTSLSAWDRWTSLLRPAPDGDGSPADGGRSGRPSRRQLRILAIGLAVAMLAATLVVARRPESFDDRMPFTGSTVPGMAVEPTDVPVGTVVPDVAAVSVPEDVLPAAPVLVHVAGAVDAPGVVELPGGSRAVDAVRAAGGLRADADPDRLNLAAVIEDGHRIVVPVRGEPAPEELVPTGSGDGSSGASVGPVGGVIDLNSATQEQLETLPGVGPATATAIISHRDANGPFRTVESLIDVRGIGEAKLDAVRDLVTVG